MRKLLPFLVVFAAASNALAANPTITSINPVRAMAGGPQFTLTVNGTKYDNNCSRQLERREPGYDVCFFHPTYRYRACRSRYSHRRHGNRHGDKPCPPARTSNAVTFTISNPVPTITSLNPTWPSGLRTVHVDRERHEFRFHFDSELERDGVGHDVCFCHTTHSHSYRCPCRHCRHRLGHCCKPGGATSTRRRLRLRRPAR